VTGKINSIALKDVMVATVLPFHPDHAIDWDSYARLLDGANLRAHVRHSAIAAQ
jgi:dihydrodipicolinate synthase/N-acetylneuraminate lyase